MEKEVGNGCSSLAYKLLFSCPFGLSQPQLSAVFDESYDRIPHSDSNLENSISQIWDQRVQKNGSLFNGKKFRYGGYSQKSGDGSKKESYVCLHLGLTDYKTFVGTNLNPSWEKFLVASEDDPTQCQHTSSPLGNGAIVETSDQKIVLLQRSDNVGEFPGHFVFPGGHPEPQEVGIETHEYCKGSKDSELVNKKVLQEMFESIIREVVEEIGVPATSLSDPLFIGISRRVLNVRPAIFFFIKCSLESKEIHQLYSKAQDGYESTQLYTVSMEQLRHEIAGEVKKLGRVSLIDLADTTGVDLYHVEKQAQHVVSEDPGLMLIQGEIISQSYWDSVAEEINERLQECSQIALAELAAQLYVGSELVASVLEPRLGTLVKGRLEGGQLYTPAYIARVSAMVRGASRGITVPTNLSVLWSSLQQLLQEMEGATGLAVEGSFFQSLFNGLVKEGEVLGTLRAGIHWTPTVFAIAQKECVDSFFSQNSFISYDTLHKLGISQPIQYLQPRFPEGIPLVTAFVHPSMIEMLDAAIEDAIERGSWLDSLSLLPTSFGAQDASKILSLSPSVQSALKANKALIVGDSYLFSSSFVKDVYDRVEKELETLSHSGSSTIILSDDSHMVKEAKAGKDLSKSSEPVEIVTESGNKKRGTEKGSKKKKGKSSGARTVSAEGDSENEDYIPTKSKKNQKKGKDASSSQVADSRKVVKKDSIKAQEENVPSEEWLMQKLEALLPDFEEQGVDDPQAILKYLADYLRPMLANYLKERRKALFTENVEKMKILLDNLQRKLDESFLNMQLYEKALDLFEDDQSTSVTLHRHLLRTVATSIADMLFHNLNLHNKLKNGTQVEDSQNSESISLSPGERTAIAKSLPESQSKRALAVVEALEGKRVETFMPALRDLAEESGLFLKKLDKKLERTLLHSYRKDLTSQVSAETDPVSLLPKVVSLLYIQVHSRALQAPGRAISVAVTRLKDKLDDSAYKILTDFQTATVTLLALISAAAGDEADCSSDRILSKKELLEGQMPALKALVLGFSGSQA